MNKKTFKFLVLLIAVIFSACNSSFNSDESSLTINLSNGTSMNNDSRSSADWPPSGSMRNEIFYQITLTGSGGQSISRYAQGGTTVVFTLAAGRWNVHVKAFYPDRNTLYATGSSNIDVLAGRNNVVTVQMYRAVPDDPVPACDHEWTWIETRDGVETKTCSVCGETDGIRLTLDIGATGPGGGIIFYTDPIGFSVEGYGNPGDTGYFASYTAYYLEAALSDASATAATWASAKDPFQSINYPTKTGIGAGKSNTAIMLEIDPASVPANDCNNYSTSTAVDWFLPSLLELRALYNYWNNNGKPANLDFTLDTYHWTSSQMSALKAYHINFVTGSDTNADKCTWSYRSRPVRAF